MTNAFQWIQAAGVAALLRPGEGGTIVIVPGAMADAEGWLPCARALRTPLSVAIMNRRGRAPSDGLPPGSTVEDEVDDVRALLSRLQAPFILMGWSYGGLLAMEAAIGLAEIASIILYEPVSRPFVPSSIEPIRRSVEAGNLDQAVAEIITRVGGASDDQVAALQDTPAWAYLKPLAIPAATELSALNRYDPHFTAYAAIEAPITVLVGSENQNREPYTTAANRFLDALPLAARVTLNGQGHLAHVEAPTQLAGSMPSCTNRRSTIDLSSQ